MKVVTKVLSTVLFLALVSFRLSAQESVVTISTSDPRQVDPESIVLNALDGWMFQPGTGLYPENSPTDSAGWRALTNQTTYAELERKETAGTWFRFRFMADSSISKRQNFLFAHDQGVYYLYLNDVLLGLHGSRSEKTPYGHDVPSYHDRVFPIQIEAGKMYELKAFLPVDFVPDILRPNAFANNVPPGLALMDATGLVEYYIFARTQVLWQTVLLVILLLFWLLYFLNPEEKVIALAAGVITMEFIFMLSLFETVFSEFLFNDHYRIFFMGAFLPAWANSIPILVVYIFTERIPRFLYLSSLMLFIAGILGPLLDLPEVLSIFTIIIPIVSTLVITIRSWRAIQGPQRIMLVGLFTTIVATAVFFSLVVSRSLTTKLEMSLFHTAYSMILPVTLLVYVAVRFRHLLFDTRRKAEENVRLAEAKLEAEQANQRILTDQNKLLETEVRKRTTELEESLSHLKATQSQLVQSEKMASLGELTAGIAHEIQNPLNFVNNFSEVNRELVDELQQELKAGRVELAVAISNDLKDNETKINFHGKRADAIVKGMLQHSRASSGKKESTDINGLCDEYLRLAYHGLRAKDKSFNAKFETHLDPALPKINVVPQDIGRVVLNLISNGFYAVSEKARLQTSGYQPQVTVTSKKLGDKIEIRVSDNGSGIPAAIKDKIFQPFFTTKPTGQGTGLGLSLSYDIVTKIHQGTLTVVTKEGEGSEFVISLPL